MAVALRAPMVSQFAHSSGVFARVQGFLIHLQNNFGVSGNSWVVFPEKLCHISGIMATRRKLSDEQVIEIRNRASQGESRESLAKEFRVTHSTLCKIVTGSARRDVGGPIAALRKSTVNTISPEEVRELRRLSAAGARRSDLARNFQIPEAVVRNLISGASRMECGGPVTPLNPKIELSEATVIDIRERRALGEPVASIADAYLVSETSICNIVTGRRHKKYGGPLQEPRCVRARLPRQLHDRQVVDLRNAFAQGASQKSLGKRFNIPLGLVRNIVTGRSFRHVDGPVIKHKPRTRLTNADVRRIREVHAAGARVCEIAKKYDVSRSAIGRYVTGSDRVEAGGPVRSPEFHASALPNDLVVRIRYHYKTHPGFTIEALSQHFKVSTVVVYGIVRGLTYKSVAGPIAPPRAHSLTPAEVQEIRELHRPDDPKSISELADRYHRAESTIYHILQGKSFPEVGGPRWTPRVRRRVV